MSRNQHECNLTLTFLASGKQCLQPGFRSSAHEVCIFTPQCDTQCEYFFINFVRMYEWRMNGLTESESTLSKVFVAQVIVTTFYHPIEKFRVIERIWDPKLKSIKALTTVLSWSRLFPLTEYPPPLGASALISSDGATRTQALNTGSQTGYKLSYSTV